MAICLGIDIGSTTTKATIIENGRMRAFHIIPSGNNYRAAAEIIKNQLLAMERLEPSEIKRTAATGHGAHILQFCDLEVLDVVCCARGIRYFFPNITIIVDIQDLSTQVIRLNDTGQVIDVVQGEACASGGGYSLRTVAEILQIDINEIGPLSLLSRNPVAFTTGCSVFAESEAISRISEGYTASDILAGLHQALAERIVALVNKMGRGFNCAVSGGGGKNSGLVKRIEAYGIQMVVPPEPLIINALGAALAAGDTP